MLLLWDVATSVETGRFAWAGKNPGAISSVAFSPDGRYILAGGMTDVSEIETTSEFFLWRVPADRELKIWRLMGGKFPEPPPRGESRATRE